MSAHVQPSPVSLSLTLSSGTRSYCDLDWFKVNESNRGRVITWFQSGQKAVEHVIPRHSVPFTWQTNPDDPNYRRISFRDHRNFMKSELIRHEFKIYTPPGGSCTFVGIPIYTLPSVDDLAYVQSQFRQKTLLGTFEVEEIFQNQNSSLLISQKKPLKLWYRESNNELTFTFYANVGNNENFGPGHIEFNVAWFKPYAHRKEANVLVLTLNPITTDGSRRRSSLEHILDFIVKHSPPSSDPPTTLHERNPDFRPTTFERYRSIKIKFTTAEDLEDFLTASSSNFYENHDNTRPRWQDEHPPASQPSSPSSIIFYSETLEERERRNEAKEWWKTMNYHRRNICMPIGPRGPVKVAVIDTGIDITNPFIAEKWKPGSTESPNEFYRDFVDDVETANTLKEDWEAHYNSSAIRIRLRSIAEREGDNPQDLHGHGTHMAGIILQLAPDAQLYVGRLMRRVSHDARDARRLALAILYAAVIWDVDIISLSIGFHHDSMSTQDRQVIRNAIKYAEAEKNIVVLAAASNSSDREKLQFPANQDRYVICINSSDGFGRRSPFNPPKQESHKSDNFSILGEYVKSTWRQDADEVAGLIERDQSGIMWKWDKGTSVATAIAAAVIVLLFQFGRTAGKSHAFSALETPQAVRRIFHLMAGAKNDDQFKNIIPWRDVLNSDWSTDRIRHVIEAEIVHLL